MTLLRRLIIALLLSPALAAAAALPAPFDPQRHMSVAEVRPGMKGYGLSVFYGTKIEKFQVQVISILHNFNPQGDVILIRCAGANLEHTGPIAGMSGSPIYLYDDAGKARLVGAFAYGWPLQKDPIAGVQPIQYMLDLPITKRPDTGAPGTGAVTRPATATASGGAAKPQTSTVGTVRWNLSDVVPLPGAAKAPDTYPFAAWNSMQPNPSLGVADADTMRLRPLVTPLMAGGIPSDLIAQMAPILQSFGMRPLQAGGTAPATQPVPGEAPASIEPGSVLAVPLLTGDVDLTAIGTCTEVLGNGVYGFGHPFNNEGAVAWPMGAGRVNTVIANLMNSFKIGAMTELRGAVRTDAMVGIAGQLGEVPPTIPIDLKLSYTDGSMNRDYHFDAAVHPRLTPLLAAFAMTAAATSARELPQYHTVDYDLTLHFSNGQTVRIDNTAVNTSPAELFYDVGLPMMAAADNPFQRVLVTRVNGAMRVTPEARQAMILSVNLPRLKFRPGETVKGFVTYRPFRGAETIMPIELTLPRDLDEGDYQLIVSDWQRYLQDEQAAQPFRFSAENIQQVFDVLHDISKIRRNALYLRLLRKPDGVAVGRTAMPHLPSSRRQVLLESGRSNTTPFVSSMVKTVPTDLVLSGAADFVLKIDRNAKVEVAGKLPKEPAKPRQPTPREPTEPQEPKKTNEPTKPQEPAPGTEG